MSVQEQGETSMNYFLERKVEKNWTSKNVTFVTLSRKALKMSNKFN